MGGTGAVRLAELAPFTGGTVPLILCGKTVGSCPTLSVGRPQTAGPVRDGIGETYVLLDPALAGCIDDAQFGVPD